MELVLRTIFYPGTGSGVNKWYIHHEGGGWCESLKDCYERSLTPLGSTAKATPTVGLPDGYFSTNQAENPTMYNWNKVFFLYCDGGSFSGLLSNPTSYDGHPLYFRGYYNLLDYAKSLTTKGLASATEVVISGCSAGGLATYLHVDWWAAHFHSSVKVRGLPDSGFFLDYNSPGNGPKYGTSLRWVFTAMNCSAGVNQDCIKANPTAPGACMFAEHTGPHIKTPIWPLQSEYDSWQAGNILGPHTDAEQNKFGQLLTQRFSASVLANPQNGGFLDSCYHHCGEWDAIHINGVNSGAGFEKWYTTGKGTYIQNQVYPCASCCQ